MIWSIHTHKNEEKLLINLEIIFQFAIEKCVKEGTAQNNILLQTGYLSVLQVIQASALRL